MNFPLFMFTVIFVKDNSVIVMICYCHNEVWTINGHTGTNEKDIYTDINRHFLLKIHGSFAVVYYDNKFSYMQHDF